MPTGTIGNFEVSRSVSWFHGAREQAGHFAGTLQTLKRPRKCPGLRQQAAETWQRRRALGLLCSHSRSPSCCTGQVALPPGRTYENIVLAVGTKCGLGRPVQSSRKMVEGVCVIKTTIHENLPTTFQYFQFVTWKFLHHQSIYVTVMISWCRSCRTTSLSSEMKVPTRYGSSARDYIGRS